MAIYHVTARIGRPTATGALSSASAKSDYILRQGKYLFGAAEVVFSDAGNMPSWAAPPRPPGWEHPDVSATERGRMARRRASMSSAYWQAADLHERANGRLFRELEFSLPRELPTDRSAALAVRFAERLCDGERLPWTLAVHRGGGGNPHAHLVISERANDGIDRPAGMWFRRASRSDPEAGGALKSRSLQTKAWLRETRAAWAELANRELASCGLDCRIDHRTLKAQREDALAAGDLALADALDRAPIHQSRSSLALESEAPDEGPGQVPKPPSGWGGQPRRRKRRVRRRRPGETPGSERAAAARRSNGELAAAKAAVRESGARLERLRALKAVQMQRTECIAGQRERLAAAAARLTAQGGRDWEPPLDGSVPAEPPTLKGRLEWELSGLDGLGPRLDECVDDIRWQVDAGGLRLRTLGDRLLAVGRRLFARIEDSPDLQRDLAGWAKSRGMTLWGRDPDEVLRSAAGLAERQLEQLAGKYRDRFDRWCDENYGKFVRGEGWREIMLDMPEASKAGIWSEEEAAERDCLEQEWHAAARKILGGNPSPGNLEDACRLPDRGDYFGKRQAAERTAARKARMEQRAALFGSAREGDLEAVRAALDSGADIDARGRGKRTALHEAVLGGHPEVVNALIKAGADLELRNDDGWTARELAERHGDREAEGLLEDAGAARTQTPWDDPSPW
ncbi:MAG: MobA/MobL family protein [Rhodospirillaceae bacterium]|nr:MobA/MobL family protein [Rhodospirillaceae bacterium]